MSEISDTTMIIRLGVEGTYYAISGVVKGSLAVYQQLKKMERAKILKGGEVASFERFMRATEGKYRILNIPTEDPREIAKMKQDFERLGIRYCMLPDLNVGDGQIQVAYPVEDANKIGAWYKSFCLDRLQPGGEKSYQDLMNYTDGQVSIINIPWADKDSPERAEVLDKAVRASAEQVDDVIILPDLNRADKSRQVAVPSYSADAFTEALERHGIKYGVSTQNVIDYLDTGVIDGHAYIDTQTADLKETLLQADRERKRQTAKDKAKEAIQKEREEPVPKKVTGSGLTGQEPEIPLEPKEPGELTLDELITQNKGDIKTIRLPLTPAPVPENYIEEPVKEGLPENEIPEAENRQRERQRGESLAEGRVREPRGGTPSGLTKEESLARLKADLDRLHINYTILPDLNVGDGYIQVAFATADTPKMRAWYEAYQADMLKDGVHIEDFREMPLESYLNTGQVPVESVRPDITAEDRTESMAKTEYENLKSQPGMQEVTINQELVQDLSDGITSRIPGTEGKEYMSIKPDMLYMADDGKTYGILSAQDTRITITDANGNILREAQFADIKSNYNDVKRDMSPTPQQVLYRREDLDTSQIIENPKVKAFQEALDHTKPRTTEYVSIVESLERDGVYVTVPTVTKVAANGDLTVGIRTGEGGYSIAAVADRATKDADGTIQSVAIDLNKKVAVIDDQGKLVETSTIDQLIKSGKYPLPEMAKQLDNVKHVAAAKDLSKAVTKAAGMIPKI